MLRARNALLPPPPTSNNNHQPNGPFSKPPPHSTPHTQILKTDTLAGLAVRYGVAVADVKRANGLLSDTGMFAREHVLIPTRQLPLSEDSQVLIARLLTGYGRDASLNAKERRAPGSVAAVQLPGSPVAAPGMRGGGGGGGAGGGYGSDGELPACFACLCFVASSSRAVVGITYLLQRPLF